MTAEDKDIIYNQFLLRKKCSGMVGGRVEEDGTVTRFSGICAYVEFACAKMQRSREEKKYPEVDEIRDTLKQIGVVTQNTKSKTTAIYSQEYFIKEAQGFVDVLGFAQFVCTDFNGNFRLVG